MDGSSTLPNRPLSVKEISAEAAKFIFNTNIPLKHWVRAADTLYREGMIHRRERNYAQAYLILLRHSNLVLDHLKTHPEYRTREGKHQVKPLLERIPKVLEQLEHIKPHIHETFEEWQRLSASQKKAQASHREPQSPYDELAAKDPALSWDARVHSKVLDAGEHRDLAVDLASKELRRRDAARKATRQAGISEEEEQERRGAGVWDDWDEPETKVRGKDEDDLRVQMDAARRQLERAEDVNAQEIVYLQHGRPEYQRTASSSASYHYPTIAKSRPLDYDSSTNGTRREPLVPPPSRPPKELLSSRYDSPPIRPDKEPLSFRERLARSPSPSLQNQFRVEQDLPKLPPKIAAGPPPPSKQERLTFKPAAYLENGSPIRSIFLPSRLRATFLNIASPNTRQGLEMCGILCGTAVNNALFISCLLIPEQKCTTDTCETENETAMLEYCMNEDLMVFGWIHTHPTQTCFMSSRDLHTQAAYQAMMPESIAIVCAPMHEPSWGVFRLTNPPGLPYILSCTRSETFHQHSIDNIYTSAGHPPGHVFETDRLDFRVEDLRPKQ